MRVEPIPCPASASTRSSTGLPEAVAACSRATIFNGSQGATRGSFIPVVSSTEGYCALSCTCWYASIAIRSWKPCSVFTVPNSGMFGGPLGENSLRSASDTPTMSIATATSSGRSVSSRPTVMPPAEPPMTAARRCAV